MLSPQYSSVSLSLSAVTNGLSKSPATASDSIEVQNPVERMTVVSWQQFALPPGELAFTITPDKAVLTPSGPFSVVVTFGDGQTTSVNKDTVSDLDFTHTYSAIGEYSLKINISNRVSSQEITQQVDILERVAGLTFSASIDGETLAVDNGNLTVKQNKDVVFSAECKRGTKVTYRWKFGSDVPQESTDTSITHAFHQVGKTVLVLNASNALGHVESVTRNIFVIAVLEVNTIACPSFVAIGGELNFDVTLVSPVKRLCVRFSIANSTGVTVFWQGASLEICKQVLPSDVTFDDTAVGFTALQSDDTVLHLRTTLHQPGNYTVSVDMYTDWLKVTETRGVTVQESTGEKLAIKVKDNLGSSPDTPIVIEKNSPIRISPSQFAVTVNAGHEKVDSTWEIFKYEEQADGRVTQTKVSLDSVGATVSAGELLIPPGGLPYGKYLCRINITMSKATDNYVTGDMYVKSVKGPLKVKIRFNEYRVIGTQQTVAMNALDDSSDRDADNDKAGMTFEWFCQRLDEASLEELVNSNATVPLPTGGESYFSITLN